MNPTRRYAAAMAAIVTTTAGLLAGTGILAGAANAATTFIGPLSQTSQIASTVPANGDQNPYGVAVVPRSTGDLHQGDVLVSNFNNNGERVQGTGTTIVQVSPGGTVSQFAGITDSACPGGVGLTTALVVLRSGWVIVGSLPTQNGSVSGAGCLIVLDSHGVVRETLAGHGINGPWDMTALDLGGLSELFVTNVLNGTVAAGGNTVNGGTVLRLLITSGPSGCRACWRSPRSAPASLSTWTRRRSSSARPASDSARTAPCTSPTRWPTGSPPYPTRYSASATTAPARPFPLAAA